MVCLEEPGESIPPHSLSFFFCCRSGPRWLVLRNRARTLSLTHFQTVLVGAYSCMQQRRDQPTGATPLRTGNRGSKSTFFAEMTPEAHWKQRRDHLNCLDDTNSMVGTEASRSSLPEWLQSFHWEQRPDHFTCRDGSINLWRKQRLDHLNRQDDFTNIWRKQRLDHSAWATPLLQWEQRPVTLLCQDDSASMAETEARSSSMDWR